MVKMVALENILFLNAQFFILVFFQSAIKFNLTDVLQNESCIKSFSAYHQQKNYLKYYQNKLKSKYYDLVYALFCNTFCYKI